MTEYHDLFTREVSASSYYAPNNETPEKAFGLLETSSSPHDAKNQWTTALPSYNKDGMFSGNYTCCTTMVDGQPIAGEWLQVEARRPQVISAFRILANHLNPDRAPRSLVLAGSNDGTVWTAMHTETQLDPWAPKESRVFHLVKQQQLPFHCFRLIVTRNSGTDGWVTIDKLHFYSL